MCAYPYIYIWSRERGGYKRKLRRTRGPAVPILFFRALVRTNYYMEISGYVCPWAVQASGEAVPEISKVWNVALRVGLNSIEFEVA